MLKQEEICEVKLFSEVRQYLRSCNVEELKFPVEPLHQYNEVYPGLYLGNRMSAEDKDHLKSLGIKLVVNAAQGSKFNQINTNSEFYSDVDIGFHGIPALDIMTFKINKYFQNAADLIEKCLKSEGKVLVHCQQGISRSAAIILAFLMIRRNMNLMQAIKTVREKREIFPNDGFLKQLCQLNTDLGNGRHI